MIQSIEWKNFIKKILIAFLVSIVIMMIVNKFSMEIYKDQILQNNARIISNLVTKYPSEEEEIIKLFQDDTPSEEGIILLAKYGITKDDLTLIASVNSFQNKIYSSTFFFFFFLFLFITLLYFFEIRKFYRHLDSINTYINAVLNGHEAFDIKEYKEGVFSNLRNDVYKITHRLKEQNEDILKDKKYLEETMSDISHQLKTPLTSMYMINNLLQDDKLDKKAKQEFLKKNEKQLERIEWLVTSLLKLSRLESGAIKLKKEKINIYELVTKAIEPLKIAIELKEQTIDITDKDNTFIIGDFNWTREALVNIIKNAHEHTDCNGTISIHWQDNPLYVLLTIKDTGEGISKEDIKHIFERFYKGSHNSKESIGIGLNMSKQIIDKQNGDILVQSVVGESTTFTIKFYKSNV